jgi:hypothetical protein
MGLPVLKLVSLMLLDPQAAAAETAGQIVNSAFDDYGLSMAAIAVGFAASLVNPNGLLMVATGIVLIIMTLRRRERLAAMSVAANSIAV